MMLFVRLCTSVLSLGLWSWCASVPVLAIGPTTNRSCAMVGCAMPDCNVEWRPRTEPLPSQTSRIPALQDKFHHMVNRKVILDDHELQHQAMALYRFWAVSRTAVP